MLDGKVLWVDLMVDWIKDANSGFDDYTIWLIIRQVLLHWGYELVNNDLHWII